MKPSGSRDAHINATLINGISSQFLSIDDRALHYGDGLFETILCHVDASTGSKLYYWSQHYSRLLLSAQRLKMPCPDENLLLDEIAALLEQVSRDHDPGKHAVQNYAIKIIISRGRGERGYLFPEHGDITRIISCTLLSTDYSSILSECLLSGELTVCRQQVSINEQLAGLKHLNRLDNVLARNEWNQQGYEGHRNKNNNFIDGLMLNADGHVIEGCMSNLFAIRERQIFTPVLTRSGVNGVMRDVIINIAENAGLPLLTENLTLPDIYKMDEIFISNSLIGLKSITRLSHMLSGELQEHTLSQNTITMQLYDAIIKTTDTHATRL